MRGRLHIDEQILLYYAGLLAQRPRSAVALEGMLEDYFGVPIEVVQFQGQWFEVNTDLLSSLGAGGQLNQLGVNAVLWERIWDPQARFRVNVGPLTYAQFRDFLPGSDGLRAPGRAGALFRRRGRELRRPPNPQARGSALVRAGRDARRCGSAGRCG